MTIAKVALESGAETLVEYFPKATTVGLHVNDCDGLSTTLLLLPEEAEQLAKALSFYAGIARRAEAIRNANFELSEAIRHIEKLSLIVEQAALSPLYETASNPLPSLDEIPDWLRDIRF